MSKHAVQTTSISRRLATSLDFDWKWVDLPPIDWFVIGPRGGRYIATGARERFITETGDDFMRNTMTVVDRSEGIRYLRPGSRLYREAGS